MKLNDVLDCFNTAIEGERVTRNLNVKGHLVSAIEIRKSMGPYKQSYIYINYVDRETGNNYRVLTDTFMDRVPTDELDAFIMKSEKQALLKLIVILRDNDMWNSIVNGTYKDGID